MNNRKYNDRQVTFLTGRATTTALSHEIQALKNAQLDQFFVQEPTYLEGFLRTIGVACILLVVYAAYSYSTISANKAVAAEVFIDASCNSFSSIPEVMNRCNEARRILDMTLPEHASALFRDHVDAGIKRFIGEGMISVFVFMVIMVTLIICCTVAYAVRSLTKTQLQRSIIEIIGRSLRRLRRK